MACTVCITCVGCLRNNDIFHTTSVGDLSSCGIGRYCGKISPVSSEPSDVMGDVGKSKVAGGRRKATVTRLLGTIERLIAEKKVELVKSNLAKVNAAFDDLETSHDSYMTYWRMSSS